MKEKKITMPEGITGQTGREIKLPEAITETREAKIYRVDYQEKTIGYVEKVNIRLEFADKDKAVAYAERIADKSEIAYVSVTEHTAIDGGIFEPSGSIMERGNFDPTVE